MEIERILDQLVLFPAPVEEHKTESKPESATTGGNAGKALFGSAAKPAANPAPQKKMIQVVKTEGLTKSKTTCPKCGEEIDAGKSVFCPYCGAEVVAKQIDIIGAKKKKYPEKCPNPKCAKKLSGDLLHVPIVSEN